MAKMRNKLQEEVNGHIEEDLNNKYAIKKWNLKIKEHKQELRRRESEARASSHYARKDIVLAKMHVDGIISSDDEIDPNAPTDYVNRNIASTEHYAADQDRKLYKQGRILENRTELYKEKRKFEEEEKLKRNVMALHKWDFIRGVRDEQIAIAMEKNRHRRQMKRWLILVDKHYQLKEIFSQFQAKLAEIALHKKRCAVAARIETVYLRNLERYSKRKNMSERYRNKIRQSLMLLAPQRFDLDYDSAADLIHRFLVKRTGQMQSSKKITDYIPLINKWGQKGLHNVQILKEKRAFMNEIITREAKIMIEYYTKKSKGKTAAAKSYKKMLGKIKDITN